jgi:hypothetical protein
MLCKWEGERADDQHFKHLRATSETRVRDSSQNAVFYAANERTVEGSGRVCQPFGLDPPLVPIS